jgi:hypothetical protein
MPFTNVADIGEMGKKRNPDQLLLDLARDEGHDVKHLPYTPEFEAVCRQFNPSANIEEKHRIWERLLGLSEADSARADPAHQPDVVPTSPPQFGEPPSAESRFPSPRVHGEAGFLFPIDEPLPTQPITDLQPWSAPAEQDLPPDQAQRRQKMLADIADSRLANSEQKVAHILHKFPETRDSDTALCIRYWTMFQAEVIERWQPLELEVLYELDRMETIGRIRRMIQNDLGLFRGVEDIRRARNAKQMEIYEYLAAHRNSLPEIRFFVDETGNEGDKAYTGVAGVCVINWKQFEKHHAALELWRAKQGWPETIHFSETGTDKLDRAVALLQQLRSRRSGVLFLGYSMASRSRTHDVLISLFIQLVVDSLRHLANCKCLNENRSVRIIKEADPGLDALHLESMTKKLGDIVAQEFPGRLTVLPIQPVPKGRTVLLECADLIAGGMQRRALFKGRNPKDRLAEAVVNVTGFEDHADTGAVFKYYSASS